MAAKSFWIAGHTTVISVVSTRMRHSQLTASGKISLPPNTLLNVVERNLKMLFTIFQSGPIRA
jgi:hypothetical protein